MKRLFLPVVAVFIVILCAGCNEQSPDTGSEIFGAWKTQEPDSLTGKSSTLVINDNSLITGVDSVDVVFAKKDGKILIIRAGETQPIYIVSVSGNKASFDNHALGKKAYVRTTNEDVKSILATPSKLQPKADPF